MDERPSSCTDAPVVLATPEELNRLLLVLTHYAASSGLSKPAVVELLRSSSFEAQILDFSTVITSAGQLGLVTCERGTISPTTAGNKFRSLNVTRSYELNLDQEEFLFNCFLHSKIYHPFIRSFFSHFQRTGETFESQLPVDSSQISIAIATFLRRLGVIRVYGSTVLCAPLYLGDISRLVQRRRISQAELDFTIALRRAQGESAEMWVLDYERDRLRKQGALPEADAVDRVSPVDVCAGYDIASFDDASSMLSYDRFIEVKSTSRSDPSFVWTSNERSVAELLGGRYWIYLLVGFRESTAPRELIQVQDPFSELNRRLSAEPISYLMTIVN